MSRARVLNGGLAVVFALSLISCATANLPHISKAELDLERRSQLERTLTVQRDQTSRLHNLLWPLIAKNSRFCKGMSHQTLGMLFAGPSTNSSKSMKQAARAVVYAHENQPVIYAVAEGSPAAMAGLQTGDRIVRIGNWIWSAEKAKEFNSSASGRMNSLMNQGAVLLELERRDERIQVSLNPVAACNVTLRVEPTLDVQARTNGRVITVTQGIAERLDDEQIRTVLAHELAHCVQRHTRHASLHASTGLLIDLAILSQRIWMGGLFSTVTRNASSIGLEREADYVAMYLLANAGLDTANRGEIWRELADEVSFESTFLTTHPYSPERYLLMNKTHEEIEAKRRAGEPLVPNGVRMRK